MKPHQLPWCTKLLKTTKPTIFSGSEKKAQRFRCSLPDGVALVRCKSVFYHERQGNKVKGPADFFLVSYWKVLESLSSLLGQKSVSVCFHLLQPLYKMVVGHFHFFDLIQGSTQLQMEKEMCEVNSWLWLQIWQRVCLDLTSACQVLFFFFNRGLKLQVTIVRTPNVSHASRSVAEMFEQQISSVLGSYLPLKFSFLCFQFIFYLFCIICWSFISGHLSFKSVYLQDVQKK